MFTPTAEHEELRRTVRRFFDTVSPEPVVRETMAGPDGLEPTLWRRMAGELGLLGMAVPEEYGGSGFGFAESALVLEEAGRALVCAPLLSTLGLAVPTLLLAADDRTRKALLPAWSRARPAWRSRCRARWPTGWREASSTRVRLTSCSPCARPWMAPSWSRSHFQACRSRLAVAST